MHAVSHIVEGVDLFSQRTHIVPFYSLSLSKHHHFEDHHFLSTLKVYCERSPEVKSMLEMLSKSSLTRDFQMFMITE